MVQNIIQYMPNTIFITGTLLLCALGYACRLCANDQFPTAYAKKHTLLEQNYTDQIIMRRHLLLL